VKAPHTHDKYFPLEWFGGNQYAWDAAVMLAQLSQTWDDIVDGDEVPQAQVNTAFLSVLAYLPTNPFYATIQTQVAPMWVPIVAAYEAANQFEAEGADDGLELSHMLRFSAGHIIAYMIVACVGREAARAIIPSMWKLIVNERYDDYRKEHNHVRCQ
jgi:hypothetical protein